MSSNAVLDIEKLLAPIDGATPSGTNLRSGAGRELYDQVRGARNQARTREKPQMMGDPTAVGGIPEEWSVVAEKSVEVIGTTSKDLELTTYLIEALVRLYGFGGLRDGFRLYRELVERFWDTAYPPDDGDGPAGRVAAMGGLNGDATRDGALLFPINRVPLTDGKDGSYAAFQYDYAVALDQLPTDRQQQRIDSGHASLKVFETAARSTSADFARALSEDLREGIQEFDKLTELLEAKCGADAPPSSRIRDALRKCLTIVESVYKDRLIEQNVEQPKAGDAPVRSESTTVAVATRAIRSRDDAFRTIEQVTRFFRETEPQSPVIYALEQVVRWGRMPLPDLLSELITDDSVRTRLFEMIGIRPKDRSNGE